MSVSEVSAVSLIQNLISWKAYAAEDGKLPNQLGETFSNWNVTTSMVMDKAHNADSVKSLLQRAIALVNKVNLESTEARINKLATEILKICRKTTELCDKQPCKYETLEAIRSASQALQLLQDLEQSEQNTISTAMLTNGLHCAAYCYDVIGQHEGDVYFGPVPTSDADLLDGLDDLLSPEAMARIRALVLE